MNKLSTAGGIDAAAVGQQSAHRVDVHVPAHLRNRNRLTCAFRPILAVPHILLVGGPAAIGLSFLFRAANGRVEWGAGTGVLGAVAGVAAVIAWFAIVFIGQHPVGLWKLAAFYLRWRVRAAAYLALLRDEYPPFGDEPYPATLNLRKPSGARNRVTVAFRIFLALPHVIVVWLLGFAWALATLVGWVSILVTGNFPAPVYHFAVGVLRWTTRVEAYLLLLDDDYPPFSLE